MKIEFSSAGVPGHRVIAAKWPGHCINWHERGGGTFGGIAFEVSKSKNGDVSLHEIASFDAKSYDDAVKISNGYVTTLVNAKDLGRLARAVVDGLNDKVKSQKQ